MRLTGPANKAVQKSLNVVNFASGFFNTFCRYKRISADRRPQANHKKSRVFILRMSLFYFSPLVKRSVCIYLKRPREANNQAPPRKLTEFEPLPSVEYKQLQGQNLESKDKASLD